MAFPSLQKVKDNFCYLENKIQVDKYILNHAKQSSGIDLNTLDFDP